jgi:ABC-type bacteriocin/lantibiotic exporter with double-glycine peptidase domain
MYNILKKINFLITKRQRLGLAVLTLLLFIGMILEVFGLGILIPAITVLLDPEKVGENPILANAKVFFEGYSDQNFILILLGAIVIIYFVKSFFLVFLTHKQNRFLNNITAYLANNLYSSYLNQPYSFHLKRNASELIKNIQIEINYLNTFLVALMSLYIEGGFVLSILAALIYIEPLGAISIGIFYGVLSVIFLQFTKKKLKYWGKLRESLDGQVAKIALEGIGGIKDILILGKTNFFINEFSNKSYLKARLNANQGTISQIPRFYLELISIIGLVSFIILLLFQGKDTTSLITVLGVFVAATFRMIPSLNRIIASTQTMKYYISSLDVVYSEIKNYDEFKKIDKNHKIFSLQKSIEFKNISFCFNKENEVLKNINLVIKRGQSIGIMGESGSGKSTLVDLLLGLLKPTSGEILIDGISGLQTGQSWRNSIGYVSQSIFLTDDSVKNNIALGIPDHQIDNKRIIELLKQTKLDKLVNEMPFGINTLVGERGIQISGGQRQRIGLARALYNNPDILILDEATSALDSETEIEVMKSIYKLKKDKTIIMIAHRLSTLENCDFIFNIEKYNCE